MLPRNWFLHLYQLYPTKKIYVFLVIVKKSLGILEIHDNTPIPYSYL